MERHLDVEVVVEAVVDRRADAEPGLGPEVLHRLRHHVGGGVAQDVVAVFAVDGHALDLVAVGELVGEVLELSGHPRGDDVASSAKSSQALVPVVTAFSSRAPAVTRAILMSDTGLLLSLSVTAAG